MFQTIYKRRDAIERHLSKPLLQERQRYLKYLEGRGVALSGLREISGYLLIVIERLHLRKKRMVSSREISASAARWGKRQSGRRRHSGSPELLTSAGRFIRVASSWLTFLGWLKATKPTRVEPKVAAFGEHLREERGLSEETVVECQHEIAQLFRQMKARGISLRRLALDDMDSMLLERYAHGHYAPRTIQKQASQLRSFFRYAESRRWCRSGIAAGIRVPRQYRFTHIPVGPAWQDIEKLLKSTEGSDSKNIRDRAILLLLTAYGFRAGEVRKLCLGDINWNNETLTVTHSKSGRRQSYPLAHRVGQAILRYLKEVRPRTACREVFMCLRSPIRPLGKTTLNGLLARRMKELDIWGPRRGPHSLRHAYATRLINKNVLLEAIADQLGHQDPETTRIYAKVDLRRLREVARFDLGGLL
jgi:site-specific recombinase XerD